MAGTVDPTDGATSYLPDDLTPEQREAIVHWGSPLRILAGPGSGKTHTLIWRAVHLIRSGRVEPSKLLITTFTDKAAAELEDRLGQVLSREEADAITVGTIHSFCKKLLEEHREKTPFPEGFEVLDQDEQLVFLIAHRRELELSRLPRFRELEYFSDVRSTFNLATEEEVNLEAWKEDCETRFSSNASALEENLSLIRSYEIYRRVLIQEHRIDFAHLQWFALNLVGSHPEILEGLQDEYHVTLIDEYQDTNVLQDELLSRITPTNLTVVGDDDQSIYRFRGATVKNILDFEERHPSATSIKLEANFRSRDPIVDHATRFARSIPYRAEKDLHATRHEETDVLLVYEHTVQEEADHVAEILQRLKAEGKINTWNDVAILLRSVKSHAWPYQDALARAGIPFHVEGLNDLFDLEVVRGLFELFIALGTLDSWADKKIRDPIVGLEERTRKALKEHDGPLVELRDMAALKSIGVAAADDRRKILGINELRRQVAQNERVPKLDLLHELLDATGAGVTLERAQRTTELRGLGRFTEILRAWDRDARGRAFKEFERSLHILKKGGVALQPEEADEAVQLMTVHKAKGLEFPIVVLGYLQNERFPIRNRSDRFEIPYDVRSSGEPEIADEEERHIADERRLFYVGVSRAQDILILATSDIIRKRGGKPSQFVLDFFDVSLNWGLRPIADRADPYIEAVTSHRDRGGPLPRYSYSKLAYYLQCPLRYKYANLYGIQPPWSDPVSFGSNVHRALEVIHREAMDGRSVRAEDVSSIVNDTWMSPPILSRTREEGIKEAAVKQIQRYLRNHGDRLGDTKAAEEDFTHYLATRGGEDAPPSAVLRGRIDLVRRARDAGGASDGVEVVDFKTSGSKDLAQEAIDLQLDLYALAAEEALDEPVTRRAVIFLGQNDARRGQTTLPWSEERREGTRERLQSILRSIEEGDYQPRTAYCSRCTEYRDICPHYDPDA